MAAENNTRDLQAFSRIFEVMSFVDRIQELSPEEIEETAHRLCQLPANPRNSMSLEEVVFWAGSWNQAKCENRRLQSSGYISDLFIPGSVAVVTGCMKSSCYS